jgi:hypothetical protein
MEEVSACNFLCCPFCIRGETVCGSVNMFHSNKELLEASFSMLSTLYQKKIGDWFFPELLIEFSNYFPVCLSPWFHSPMPLSFDRQVEHMIKCICFLIHDFLFDSCRLDICRSCNLLLLNCSKIIREEIECYINSFWSAIHCRENSLGVLQSDYFIWLDGNLKIPEKRN